MGQGIKNVFTFRRIKMENKKLAEEIGATSYPGRGIVIGLTPDGKKAAIAYFIMGRSSNSRNRVFVEEGQGIKTQAYDGKDFHALRKTYATNLLISGTPLESVASSLGDAGVQAAKPYLALDDDRLRLCCQEKMPFPCRKAGLHA